MGGRLLSHWPCRVMSIVLILVKCPSQKSSRISSIPSLPLRVKIADGRNYSCRTITKLIEPRSEQRDRWLPGSAESPRNTYGVGKFYPRSAFELLSCLNRRHNWRRLHSVPMHEYIAMTLCTTKRYGRARVLKRRNN